MTQHRGMSCLLAGAAIALATAGTAMASSHREAPGITLMPKVDATDFYMFRSYEQGKSGYVTLIANYQPNQDPGAGPNYYEMDPNAFYDINVDNRGDGKPHIVARFRFFNQIRGLTVAVGNQHVSVPIVPVGPVAADNPTANLNVVETYQLTILVYDKNGVLKSASPLVNDETGDTFFTKPVDNIGHKTIADYQTYANKFVYNVRFPGKCGAGKIFAGQRKDSFFINLGETFDLINYAHPIGETFANSAMDDLAHKNVTSLAIEVPIACLVRDDPVIGGWTTAYKIRPQKSDNSESEDSKAPAIRQVSRLGNPLVNELAIGLPDKDKFNASEPEDDGQFLTYVTNPSLPALIHALYPSLTAPTQLPRQDLVAVFLTGVVGLNQPANVTPAEEMRLNTQTPVVPAASQNPLGVIASDVAGYPNGRRPGDDVVDISLRVFMGKLYTLGLFGGPANGPSGDVELTDGVRHNASYYDVTFPYVTAPIAGSPQASTQAASQLQGQPIP
ncbi:MAG: hypothetical protein JWM91_2910 [Rhodospirillales bacterium]|nr:hypothetical protein [Rhodospirillales bacterium]